MKVGDRVKYIGTEYRLPLGKEGKILEFDNNDIIVQFPSNSLICYEKELELVPENEIRLQLLADINS